MFLSVVTLLNVFDVKHSASVLVDGVKCLLHKLPSALIHLTHQSLQELLVVDLAVAVWVECVEDCLHFLFIGRYTVT